MPISLIGTVHLDLKAAPVLFQLLETIRPECVTVEISRFSLWLRQAFETRWKRRLRESIKGLEADGLDCSKIAPQLELLHRQISMPFEWECARRYAARHGARCLPVDSGDISRRELPFWDLKLLTRRNLKTLFEAEAASQSRGKDPLKEIFSRQYRQARGLFRQGDAGIRQGHLPFCRQGWAARERAMAARIVRAHKRYSHLAHIGGWLHMVRPGSGISAASLLDSYAPAIYLVTADGVLRASDNRALHDEKGATANA